MNQFVLQRRPAVNRRQQLVMILSLLFIAGIGARELAALDVAKTAAGMLQNGAFGLLNNPAGVYSDLQNTFLDQLPIDNRRLVGVHTDLLGDVTTHLNVSAKVRLLNEDRFLPQLTVGAGYCNFLAPKWLPPELGITGADLFGIAAFVTLAKNLDETRRLFIGYQHSYGSVKANLSGLAGKLTSAGGDALSRQLLANAGGLGAIAATYLEPMVYGGMGIHLAQDWEAQALIGFQFGANKLFIKLVTTSDFFEFGLGISPDSIWAIYFTIAINLRFGS